MTNIWRPATTQLKVKNDDDGKALEAGSVQSRYASAFAAAPANPW